jgi:hypothetical protein
MALTSVSGELSLIVCLVSDGGRAVAYRLGHSPQFRAGHVGMSWKLTPKVQIVLSRL